jgi:hypothetical protein
MQIDNSLRFNDGDNPRLTRTMATGTSRRIFTFSTWLKRSHLGTFQYVFANTPTSSFDAVRINSDDTLDIRFNDNAFTVRTNRVYRDVSSWYHILVAVDTTQSTASDRVKIYTNGSLETSLAGTTYPTQNYDTSFGVSGEEYQVSTNTWNDDQAFDGYLAETHFIDGQALSPTDFGEFDEDSGIWKPIRYSGSYGTNGFYLDFENSGSLGADQSGNGNNFTPTNLASTDQTTDTPTNNFATLNPLSDSGATLSEGNTQGVGSPSSATSTIAPTSGKWYVEFQNSALQNSSIGLVNLDAWASTTDIYPFAQASAVLIENNANYNVTYGNTASSPTTLQTGTQYNTSKYGFAFDLDNGNVYVSADGNWYGGSDFNQAIFSNAVAVTTDIPTNTPMAFFTRGSFGSAYYVNFGNPPPSYSISSGNSDDNGYGNFEYAPPSGYLALCTQNLATELSPTIDDGSQYFGTTLWVADDTSPRTLTGFGHQPDFLWVKHRGSGSINHTLVDSSRGGDKMLASNITNAEDTKSHGEITSFNADGITVADGTSGSYPRLYFNDFDPFGSGGGNYVAWHWVANAGSTSSNTDGSITSTVQANTTAGFSIVTYTGTGSVATVGHGLGKAPAMMIFKNRDAGGNYWRVYHQSLGATKNLVLNGTFAQLTETAKFNDTEPTSSVFTVGNDNDTNASSQNILSYCFAEIEGYSKFGSFTGNSNSDNVYIHLGFRPSFFMYKVTDTTGNWIITDSARDSYNYADKQIYPNLSNAESSVGSIYSMDLLSSGVKIRNSGVSGNHIYMAFAENPFVTSGGLPVTAR